MHLLSLIASTPSKCHRKETWERIRRRPSKLNSRSDKNSQDVWVKRESVHTQTKQIDDQYSQDAVDSSSGLDDSLPRIRTPRPTNLPLCESRRRDFQVFLPHVTSSYHFYRLLIMHIT
ncbi:hypothetical protein P5V15_014527 [Pogonomyrmex californicus]